jgi:hypothetical protein
MSSNITITTTDMGNYHAYSPGTGTIPSYYYQVDPWQSWPSTYARKDSTVINFANKEVWVDYSTVEFGDLVNVMSSFPTFKVHGAHYPLGYSADSFSKNSSYTYTLYNGGAGGASVYNSASTGSIGFTLQCNDTGTFELE